jgi:hypothetical protein
MQPPLDLHDAYGVQVALWARALATGNVDGLSTALAEGSSLKQVQLFVEGNFEKRHQLLRKYLEFVSDAFEDIGELLWDYVNEVPLAALDTVSEDADRFLHWLQGTSELTPVQEDFVRCQRARFAIETRASKKRTCHLRFQELWRAAGPLAGELDRRTDLHVHLNPIRARTRLKTPALLDDETPPPADVLFFAMGTGIRTAALDGRGLALVRELASLGPWALDAWASTTTLADRVELLGFCRELAGMGLLAFRTQHGRPG